MAPDAHQQGLLPHWGHWLTEGQHVAKALVRCYVPGQASEWLKCTRNQRRTFPASAELVGWSSARARATRAQEQQAGAESKTLASRRARLSLESLMNFLNILLPEMAFAQKRLLLNKLAHFLF